MPQRTCVVCRETSAKRTLTRVVRVAAASSGGTEEASSSTEHQNDHGGIYVDPTGKRNGRGAYLCDKRSCWKRAIETDVLAKALRTTLTDADRARLQEVIAAMTTDQTQDQQG